MHLLDVNVWLALAFQRHTHHPAAARWFGRTAAGCVFCRLTQAGFLRLATSASAIGPAAVKMADAWRAYDIFRADPKILYADEPAGLESVWRTNTQNLSFSPKVWNDAYLAAFAQLAGLEVVTFDQGFAQFSKIKLTILK
jgi:toxin-antitoxin system PIN domain toxin